ncbi:MULTISPECIES: hypothetical protein [Bacillus]|uniref:hypothetical protein n=1 Tax=Bacillus TaxID=1386 RepID=UPI00046F37D4|nr:MULTISPECIES: hypothetical protein [Bacillus]AUS17051.1 hypothetical protein C0W57_13085 [Bacillus velezensis]MBL4957323.1 hypothetical protein [Bacillus velezensis]MBM7029821.1 hypothetical protein [Bacillus velezensis]MBT0952062.1 hypothetical protein [Bacillus velezensis]MCM3276331.1 hypothetical protein [Bacillus velezensis]
MKGTILVNELSAEKQAEFEKLTDDYSYILQLLNLFIQTNNLDYDEAWDIANQRYDEDMTYAPNE